MRCRGGAAGRAVDLLLQVDFTWSWTCRHVRVLLVRANQLHAIPSIRLFLEAWG